MTVAYYEAVAVAAVAVAAAVAVIRLYRLPRPQGRHRPGQVPGSAGQQGQRATFAPPRPPDPPAWAIRDSDEMPHCPPLPRDDDAFGRTP